MTPAETAELIRLTVAHFELREQEGGTLDFNDIDGAYAANLVKALQWWMNEADFIAREAGDAEEAAWWRGQDAGYETGYACGYESGCDRELS